MPELNGSQTEKNLRAAFAGESQARNKYTYFAKVAQKEGYERLAAYFLETAENEMEHAKLHFKLLNGIGSTAENLRAAAAGETDEFTEMYPRMAQEAKDEGFLEIAFLFQSIARIEKSHQQRYQQLLSELEAGTLFSQPEPGRWRCRKCGHLHEGLSAPNVCPVCKHPQAYFELVEDHY